MILDAGFLIAVDRDSHAARELLAGVRRHGTPLRTTQPVVGQVWRDGARQAHLAKLLGGITLHPFDDGRAVGSLLARSGTADVVDAHLVTLAVALSEPVLTSDMSDLQALAAHAPSSNRPEILSWP